MTNEEAIKFGIETLEYMRDCYPYMDDERKQALNFAIKALKKVDLQERMSKMYMEELRKGGEEE